MKDGGQALLWASKASVESPSRNHEGSFNVFDLLFITRIGPGCKHLSWQLTLCCFSEKCWRCSCSNQNHLPFSENERMSPSLQAPLLERKDCFPSIFRGYAWVFGGVKFTYSPERNTNLRSHETSGKPQHRIICTRFFGWQVSWYGTSLGCA